RRRRCGPRRRTSFSSRGRQGIERFSNAVPTAASQVSRSGAKRGTWSGPGCRNMAQDDFTGRVALVTGASRGFGLATAERLAARGAAVAVHVRDSARAEIAARRLGDRGFAVAGDLGSSADRQAIIARTLDRFGRLDVLVNNAAVALSTRFEKI